MDNLLEASPEDGDLELAMEALLLDVDGIGEIEARLGGFNIFETILRRTRAEERHSNFLAFLLDPNGTHGLGTEFLSRFVVEALKAMRPESRPVSLSEMVLTDFGNCHVHREHNQIDVVCINRTLRFVLAIENKVGSGEHSDQLRRYRSFLEGQYRDYRRVLAYLTPDNEAPSDEDWAPVGYGEVLSIVESLADRHKERLEQAVFICLDHYARMLRRNIVSDDKLEEIARAVYRRHKAALDFIFEKRPDDQLEIGEFAADLASRDERVEVVRRTKAYINFFPKAWRNIPAFNATPIEDWTRSGHTLLFEFRNMPDSVRMAIVIGPAPDDDLRRRILDFGHENPKMFPGATSNLYPKYTQIYSRTLIDRTTYEREPIEEIKDRLEGGFQRFMDEQFQEIVEALAERFS